MNGFSPCAILLSMVLVFSFGHASAQDKIEWKNARDLEIEGMGWSKTGGPFDRLPDTAKSKVNSTAWDQSKESAGICVRFATNSAAVSVRWSLTSASLAMPHMPATGCSGLDLYARDAKRGWRFIGNCRPGKQDGNQSTIEFSDGAQAQRECLLYLPAYNGTKSLEIGAPAGRKIEKSTPRPEGLRRSIVVYGTSITQGGCASRPGMVWTSILGRMLDRPVINLGFSASGDMAAPVGEVLAEIEAAAYVIDCTWNMGTGKEMFLDHVTKLVQAIRATHPVTPILFLGQSIMRPGDHPSERTRDQESAVQSAQKAGVKGLVIVPPNDFIGDDGEGTVDGVHYNDIGMQRQATALFLVVSKILSEASAKAATAEPSLYIDTDLAAGVDDSGITHRVRRSEATREHLHHRWNRTYRRPPGAHVRAAWNAGDGSDARPRAAFRRR